MIRCNQMWNCVITSMIMTRDWAGWKREYSANMTKLHCINPRPSQKFCALDRDLWKNYKVVKYFGNRSYLCRWNIKASLNIETELKEILGIQSVGHFAPSSDAVRHVASEVDLYEVAGCLLRLAVSPTDLLWDALDHSLQSQMNKILSPLQDSLQSEQRVDVPSPIISEQIGFHFRCGDSSFAPSSASSEGAKRPVAPNPQCWVNPDSPGSWAGTSFTDDKSMDSPLDLALCGHQILRNSTFSKRSSSADSPLSVRPSSPGSSSSSSSSSSQGLKLLYIASDNPISSQQINETILHLLHSEATSSTPLSSRVGLIRPPKACHVDLAGTGSGHSHCSLQTSVHWFMLALSDHLVLQALLPPTQGFSMYESAKEGARFDPFTSPFSALTAPPVSAFSRYAAIYSLGGDSTIRYGRSCSNKVSMALLSHQSHGNWVCDPKMFY